MIFAVSFLHLFVAISTGQIIDLVFPDAYQSTHDLATDVKVWLQQLHLGKVDELAHCALLKAKPWHDRIQNFLSRVSQKLLMNFLTVNILPDEWIDTLELSSLTTHLNLHIEQTHNVTLTDCRIKPSKDNHVYLTIRYWIYDRIDGDMSRLTCLHVRSLVHQP